MIKTMLAPIKALLQSYKHSLKITLISWFLILSFIPFILVAWYGYIQTVKSVDELQRNKLSNESTINVAILKERFDASAINLHSWAQLKTPARIFQSLSVHYGQSSKSLGDFVHSDEYTTLVDAQPKSLVNLAHEYDYVYDLFLIDLKGNILYTIKHESDLGTNLLNGPY